MAHDGKLGNGDNRVVIYERGGERPLFTLPALASVEWSRNLDAVSRGTFVCTPNAADRDGVAWTSSNCAGLLRSIQPWAHEAVVFRNDERVWEGPVRRPVQSRAGVTITASDVLGWTERRVVHTAVLSDAVSVRDLADGLLTAAYTADDPNVLDYVTALGNDDRLTSVDIKPGAGYYSGAILGLASAGLSITTIGRRVLIWAEPGYTLGSTAVLNTARHLLAGVETAHEGDALTTRAWAANDQQEYATDGGTDGYYGLVETLTSASGITGPALTDAAALARSLHYPAPETVDVPDGAGLHCDAPFPIAALVPGVLTRVQVSDLCWPVEQVMVLTGVKVKQGPEGETVGVTYAPIPEAA